MLKRFTKLAIPAGAAYIGFKWFIQEPLDFASRYGAGSWVIITGASDGIGLGYAKSFAKRGFNIVMIARDEIKLEQAAIKLNSEYGIELKCLALDFASNPRLNSEIISA
jgi:17beta-estradiol 17-dehydrogenase / very-long-chain 3-oxoacyl-CoA reductase